MDGCVELDEPSAPPNENDGIGLLGMPDVGIGDLGMGVDGMAAEGIGVFGMGVDGIGDLGIGNEGMGELGIDVFGIPDEPPVLEVLMGLDAVGYAAP